MVGPLLAVPRKMASHVAAVTGPHCVPLASSLSGTFTGNRPLTGARAHSFTINFKAIF